MARDSLSELVTFVAVARERTFTRAAEKLGVSPSAVSHSMRSLEARTGVRLLSRTTRSVSPTEAGERLFAVLDPRFEEITAELAVLGELSDKPVGTIRITATDYAANTALWPRLSPLLAQYPDLKIEIVNDYGLTDIVSERFDLGVRTGDQVSGNMIAVRISPDIRLALVAAPSYLSRHAAPREAQDLPRHNCINLRLPTHGGLMPWEFRNGKKTLQVRVQGQATFSGSYQVLEAALGGSGPAHLPLDLVQPHLEAGRLQPVLAKWWPSFPGLHVFYSSRRQLSRALTVVVDALRYQPIKRAGATSQRRNG